MSLGRRLQDPLAELVKIPPQSIGVGQYQHDLTAAALERRRCTGVVESVVNRVGVDLNTASASLLGYVAGVSATVAKNIVAYREENGAFTDRRQLKKVPKLGAKAYQNCAGFLRISGGANPLDATSVHPESYPVAREVLKRAGVKPEALANGGVPDVAQRVGDVAALAAEPGRGRTDAARHHRRARKARPRPARRRAGSGVQPQRARLRRPRPWHGAPRAPCATWWTSARSWTWA